MNLRDPIAAEPCSRRAAPHCACYPFYCGTNGLIPEYLRGAGFYFPPVFAHSAQSRLTTGFGPPLSRLCGNLRILDLRQSFPAAFNGFKLTAILDIER